MRGDIYCQHCDIEDNVLLFIIKWICRKNSNYWLVTLW